MILRAFRVAPPPLKWAYSKSFTNLKGQKSNIHKGFTLAEVLITLGIIGIVAAMTLPGLIAKHRKTVIETKLARFYSTMNQALLMAKANYGDLKDWDKFEMKYEQDEEGKNDTSKPLPNWEYFNKYFRPYLKNVRIDDDSIRSIKVYFSDGSMAGFSAASIIYFTDAKNHAYIEDEDGNISEKSKQDRGKTSFTFYFNPTDNTVSNKYHYNRGIEPYKSRWDGTEDDLRNDSALGCKESVSNERAYCTALIQINGWKIPKDYPVKF